MTHYALFGHPVEHSLSPRIHAHFAKQTGMAMDYAVIDATPERFADALAGFANAGGVGANITLPHKAVALLLCHEISDHARRCGAVNTLTHTDNGWHGDNTDGKGLVRDLTGREQHDLRERRTLLLGAGGAAAGIAPALIDAGIGDLYIVNRTPERADALADALGMPGRVHSRYWKDLATLGNFDLIVNATSAARANEPLHLPMKLAYRNTLAVDLGYGDAAVDLLAWARSAGCQDAIDGLGMLVEQAAESFAIWHGVRPQTEPVYTMLRSELLAKATD
ncbi:MAG: shikimate dehydrogenase [Lysobacteraceae bacterium]